MGRSYQVVVVGQRAGQAAAAATFLGGPGVALVGCVGSEQLKTSLVTELGHLQVDVSRLRKSLSPGDALRPDDVCGDEVANADVLLVGLDVPPETARAAMYYARGKVVLDPTPADGQEFQPERVEALAPFVHVMVPDAMTVAAMDESNPLDAEIYQQAGDLAERLRVNVVVPPGPAEEAGDCFRGVLALLLAEKTPLPEAVRIAVRAASVATLTGKLPARNATAPTV
ncbi:carbohydrate kinase family protein [Kineosporia babensis]|uniref:Uncharacterized protein n=1 Tax=Kineosporia babensis TaxID=499548 RepID=A0A9X1NMZ0_9ACTN|nr:hypothetical protein [Kineosporia babensis]MCD5316489.1 hypothetical protein [Kineosporia babensis]